MRNLPEAEQDRMATLILEEESLQGWTEEDLRQEIERDLAGGPAKEIDFEAAKRRGRHRLKTSEQEYNWARQAIQQATGQATRGLTTDEVLALTRDDD